MSPAPTVLVTFLIPNQCLVSGISRAWKGPKLYVGTAGTANTIDLREMRKMPISIFIGPIRCKRNHTEGAAMRMERTIRSESTEIGAAVQCTHTINALRLSQKGY